MSKFVLIDHSLSALGGHHYEYAAHVLAAAASAGFDTHLACGVELRDTLGFPKDCQVYPLFRHPTYGRCSRLYDQREQLRKLDQRGKLWRSSPVRALVSEARDPKALLRDFKLSYRRPLWRHRFGAACERLFQSLDVGPEDHVFLPTVSEFDLLCLAHYLRGAPKEVRSANWHLQFHLSFLDGRGADAVKNGPRLAFMRHCFETAQGMVAPMKLNFYTTTPGLAEHYGQLNTEAFVPLPYPANSSLSKPHESVSPDNHSPLKIVVAGKPRKEKGSHLLQMVVDSLWDEYFSKGRIQLLVQSKNGSAPVRTSRRQRSQLPEGFEPIVAVPYPLDVRAYSQLIRGADIGLLLYDSEEYFVRCSGVLVELLSAGKPCLVPAACWLADQSQAAQEAYWQACEQQAADESQQASWQITIPAGGVAGQLESATPPGVQGIFWRAAAHGPASHFARIEVQARDSGGLWNDQAAYIVPCGRDETPMGWCELPHGTESIRVKAYNAFSDEPITLKLSGRLCALEHSQPPRLGAVGLTVADWNELPRLLRDLVDRFPEYQADSREFAKEWSQRHDPMRTVELLTDAAAGDAVSSPWTEERRAA